MRRHRRIHDDRGVTVVVVAVLAMVFLLGIGAVVVDAGSWYAEKAQLQNGADAGALVVAQTCANGSCAASAATERANQNSNDKTSTVQYVCGNGPGLSACGSTLCPSSSGQYVNVQTLTRTTDGKSALPPMLAKLPPFNRKAGRSIHACAQAKWGPPQSLGNAVALTISACEWYKNTANGTKFASIPSNYSAAIPSYTNPPTYLDTITARRTDPAYNVSPGTNFYVTSGPGGKGIYDPRNPKTGYTANPPAPSNATVAGSETVITTHGFGNTCNSGNPGSPAPGLFEWLSNSTCSVSISGNTYTGVSGNSAAPCEAAFTASRNTKTPIFLPVYNAVSGTTYTLQGFAAFVVTGWDVTSGSASNFTVKKAPSLVALADSGLPSQSTNANYCGSTFTGSNSDVCIYGFFTQALIPAAALPGGGGGGNPLGATSTSLSG